MARPLEYDTFNPSPETLEMGQRFGAWFRNVVLRSGLNISKLAEKMGVTRQSLYPYRDDCIAPDGRFRRPTVGIIRSIAEAAQANADEGIAIIYGDASRQSNLPSALLALSPDAQQALATAILALQPGPGRVLSPDEMQILDAYEDLPEPARRDLLEHAERLRVAASAGHKKRTDIIGKRSDEDENPSGYFTEEDGE